MLHGTQGKDWNSWVVFMPMWISLGFGILINSAKAVACYRMYRKMSRVSPSQTPDQLAVKLASNLVLSGKGEVIYWFIYFMIFFLLAIFLAFYCLDGSRQVDWILTVLFVISLLSLTFFTAVLFMAEKSLMYILVYRRKYFEFDAKLKIPKIDKVKIALENKVFVKMSASYFNSNPLQIKQAAIKRKMIKKFMRDMKEEAKVPFTPSSVVRQSSPANRYNIGADHQSSSKIGRLNSMHDILKKSTVEDGHKEVQGREISPSTANGSALLPTNMLQTPGLRTPTTRRNTVNTLSQSPKPTYLGVGVGTSVTGLISPGANAQINGDQNHQKPSNFISFVKNRDKMVSIAEEKLNEKITMKIAECSICTVAVANAMYAPCYHGGTCVICAKKCYLQDVRQCPICRQVLSFNVDHRESLKNRIQKLFYSKGSSRCDTNSYNYTKRL
jgi:Zinc finger, C3HC4 type (RING finger)